MFGTVLDAVFPPQCLACGVPISSGQGLCGPCRALLPVIAGAACRLCGLPLVDGAGAGGLCPECEAMPPSWEAGAAAFLYAGTARRLVLALKHGDRAELATWMAGWMARAARRLLTERTILVPVPLHWSRRVARRFDQAALLAAALGRELEAPVAPGTIVRVRRTRRLGGLGRDERRALLQGAMRPAPRAGRRLGGRDVLLVDDVLTSGATMAATAAAARAAGAASVRVVTATRVEPDRPR